MSSETEDQTEDQIEGMQIIRAAPSEAASCFGRFLNAPENEAALNYLIRAQAVRSHPDADGAAYQIWMNEGRRTLAAELLGFMVPREE